MIFGFARKKNIFLLQHYHPIRHIHCQIAASEFLTDFDSWDMLTIIGSRSPVDMNKYARFDEIPLMTLKDIKETKRYGRTDERTDNVKTVYPPTNTVCGGYNNVHVSFFARKG